MAIVAHSHWNAFGFRKRWRKWRRSVKNIYYDPVDFPCCPTRLPLSIIKCHPSLRRGTFRNLFSDYIYNCVKFVWQIRSLFVWIYSVNVKRKVVQYCYGLIWQYKRGFSWKCWLKTVVRLKSVLIFKKLKSWRYKQRETNLPQNIKTVHRPEILLSNKIYVQNGNKKKKKNLDFYPIAFWEFAGWV